MAGGAIGGRPWIGLQQPWGIVHLTAIQGIQLAHPFCTAMTRHNLHQQAFDTGDHRRIVAIAHQHAGQPQLSIVIAARNGFFQQGHRLCLAGPAALAHQRFACQSVKRAARCLWHLNDLVQVVQQQTVFVCFQTVDVDHQLQQWRDGTRRAARVLTVVEPKDGFELFLRDGPGTDQGTPNRVINSHTKPHGLFQIAAQGDVVFDRLVRVEVKFNHTPCCFGTAHVSGKAIPCQRQFGVCVNHIALGVFLCDAFRAPT